MTEKTLAYPSWTCVPCGKEYGSLRGKENDQVSCFHYGKCDVCGKNAGVTEPKDFGHFKQWFK